MSYRKDLIDNSYTNEETVEYNFTYITKDDAINILYEIRETIKPIQGLDVIDELKDLLESLSNDLY